MHSMIEAINRRISVRTYSARPIEEEKKQSIRDLLHANHEGPFGHNVRFALIDFSQIEKNEIKTLGTYGIISGAGLYIVSAVKAAPRAMEDLGYCFEKVVLAATTLGLGTCWMGGTFRRASFAKRISISEGEVVPVVSPIGYPCERRSIKDTALRRFAGSDQRKPWDELFFDGKMTTPLSKDAAGSYATALECVRLGPSASNNQPWRILKQKDNTLHFYVKRTLGYDKMMRSVDLQLIDMGIAMCHFELAAREAGLTGRWEEAKPDVAVGKAEYVVSWTPS
jgi:nitroreductase